MKLNIYELELGGEKIEVEVAHLDSSDGKKYKELFDIWRDLNIGLEKYGRKVNIPEVISEGMFCVFTKSVRYQRKISGKGTVSFDTINLKTSRREQIKATSVEKDLTSFGPKTEWDDLYFMDFYNGGKLDGSFNLYLIPNELIYSNTVNKHQTMKQQQDEKRRPRFSIIDEIINKEKLKPLARNVIVWN